MSGFDAVESQVRWANEDARCLDEACCRNTPWHSFNVWMGMRAWSCGQLPVGRSYKFPTERMIASTRGNTALRLQLANLQQELFLSTALLASTNCLNHLSGFHASPSDASLQWRRVLQVLSESATVGLHTSTDSSLIPRNASTGQ
jgi:hypothetical protein